MIRLTECNIQQADDLGNIKIKVNNECFSKSAHLKPVTTGHTAEHIIRYVNDTKLKGPL